MNNDKYRVSTQQTDEVSLSIGKKTYILLCIFLEIPNPKDFANSGDRTFIPGS